MMNDQWCRDTVQIADLIARIAYTSDVAEEVEDYLALMTDDVEFHFPDNPSVALKAASYIGRDEVRRGVVTRRGKGLQGPGSHTLHVTSTVFVDILDEGTANASAYWCYYAETNRNPVLRSMGQYDNRLRRVGDSWRLARRVISII
jgi:hypothetical protein